MLLNLYVKRIRKLTLAQSREKKMQKAKNENLSSWGNTVSNII